MEAVLACLPGLTHREAADEVAVNFCYVNSKGARRRMVLLLFPTIRISDLEKLCCTLNLCPSKSLMCASCEGMLPSHRDLTMHDM